MTLNLEREDVRGGAPHDFESVTLGVCGAYLDLDAMARLAAMRRGPL